MPDACGAPDVNLDEWQPDVSGLVEQPGALTLADLQQLPQAKVFSDFHCDEMVTGLASCGRAWRRVPSLHSSGAILPRALSWRMLTSWTTNLPLEHFLAEDALSALLHDGHQHTAARYA